MSTIISVNGVIRPPEEAVVSVFDRGFLYGDSVYEVVRTYGGVPFAVRPHLERLRSSARQLRMEIPLSDGDLAGEIGRAVDAASNAESYARLIVTRGSGPIELHPGRATDPVRIVIVKPLEDISPEEWEAGIAVAIVSRRRNDPRALDPAAKTGNYLNNVLAIVEARDRGADDAVLLNRDGFLTEGTTANVFVVRDGRIRTPTLESGILGGITRRIVLDLLAGTDLEVEETQLRASELTEADEAFFTSTTRGVLPLVSVDGRSIGRVRPGPVTRRVSEVFERHVR